MKGREKREAIRGDARHVRRRRRRG